MQFSFPNKVSAHPQFLSFKSTQEDGTRKTGFDSLTSTGLMTISSAEALRTDHKQCSSITQKNSAPPPEKQSGSGTHYAAMTTYSPHSIPRHHEVRILPVDNHKISVTAATPHQSSSIASAGHNVIIGSIVSPQQVPVIISPVPTVPNGASSIVGSTDLRNGYIPSGAPTQLTIFYDGLVCVYNDISPEKAQAIMLLAGNGHSATPNNTITTLPVEAPPPRPPVVKGFFENQSHNSSPRPVSVTSHPAAKSSGGTLTSPSSMAKPSKTVISLGSVSTATIPSAVPQARKASLARFLEKRKERVRSTSPYASISANSESKSLSMNSLGSCPFPATQ